jgi:uncharacterized protein YcbX
MAQLARITLFPVKSLDGIEVDRATLLPCGALADDRRWRLVDLDGHVVNAKRTPLMHPIRATFELGDAPTVSLAVARPALGARSACTPAPASFPLRPGPSGPCAWLSEALGIEVLIQERPEGGFPDDRDATGPTLVSSASLDEVARWFSLPIDEIRRRFRVNLEIEGCEPFWEDTLASPACPPPLSSIDAAASFGGGSPAVEPPPSPPLSFHVGGAVLTAVNVCRRCPVPTRDSGDGRVTEYFRDVFEAWRRRRLRRDVDASSWGGFYRLAINTIGDGRGVNVEVGDRIEPVAHLRRA